MNNIKKVDKRKNMGLYSEIKEAREQSKATKREHLYKLAVEAVKNGTYKFTYGYNSDEALQEIEEVVDEMNEELEDDGLSLDISSTSNARVNVYNKNEFLGTFDCTLLISVETL